MERYLTAAKISEILNINTATINTYLCWYEFNEFLKPPESYNSNKIRITRRRWNHCRELYELLAKRFSLRYDNRSKSCLKKIKDYISWHFAKESEC